MLWRIINIVKGKMDEEKGKKSKESFSLEFCKIDALIPPDIESSIQFISSEEIIFKSTSNLEEGGQIDFRISYHPVKPPKASLEVLDTQLKLLKKGQLGTEKFLYKAQYVNKNEPNLKKFFKYLKDIEELQIDKKVDYHDRRVHFRVNRVLPVFSKNLKDYKCLTKNISIGGVMLACSGGIKRGDVISLRLELDDYSQDPLQLMGEVCWVEDTQPNQIHVGIRFVEISDFETKILNNYIESIRKHMQR